MGIDFQDIFGVVKKLPNIANTMGKTDFGLSLLSSALAKIGLNVTSEDLKLVYNLLDEIKVSEGLDSVVDVLSSDKYKSEIEQLLSLVTGNKGVDHLTLGSEAMVVCRSCGYSNRVAELIEDYNEKQKA